MIITKGDTSKVTNNFTMNEFYCKSFNAPKSHYFDEKLIQVAQYLRDLTHASVIIDSSFRTKEHQAVLIANIQGAAKNSQHELGKAVDLKFATPQILASLCGSIDNKDAIFKKLRQLGVRGFGLYDTFIHLDTREGVAVHRDEFGTYALWDNRKKKVKLQATLSLPILKRTDTQIRRGI